MRQGILMRGAGLIPAAILAVAIIILVNTGITGVRLDLTDARLYTLSQGTENILASLEEPIRLDFYFSRKTLDSFPSMINYGNRVGDLLREYAAKSGGKLKLTVIEPEPFSEAEDQAVASGLQGVAVNTAGDNAYFGLVARNSVDDEKVIAFFQNQREASLEYDLTKLIYNLANPRKPAIGVISSLPVFGAAMLPGQPPVPPQTWAIIESMREFFDVRELTTVTDDIDVLMVIHPKDLPESTLFDIDQFVLRGGKAMFFVDPLAESDNLGPDPQNPSMPDPSSHLDRLLNAWGLEIPGDKVVGDAEYAMRVQTRSPRGQSGILYLPWLGLQGEALNREDFATNELEVVNTGSAGAINKKEDSKLTVTPLLRTSSQTMLLERIMLQFRQDPESILNNFKSEDKQRDIAVRLSGRAQTAFPEGAPGGGEQKTGAENKDFLKEGDINVILVADTDLLSDMFWVRAQNFLGMQINQAIADNGDFIINALDNLSGSNDLISLRSRGASSRPFTRVEEIRREAEERFRLREQELQERLKETEQRIVDLQGKGGSDSGGMILSPEQAAEIEKFRAEMLETRKELRAVQHELQKDIEGLGIALRFINVGLVPLLIAIGAVGAGVYRSRHYN